MKWEGNRQSDNVKDRRGTGRGFGGKSIVCAAYSKRAT